MGSQGKQAILSAWADPILIVLTVGIKIGSQSRVALDELLEMACGLAGMAGQAEVPQADAVQRLFSERWQGVRSLCRPKPKTVLLRGWPRGKDTLAISILQAIQEVINMEQGAFS